MNRVLVAQAAAGIAKFLLTQPEFNSDVEPPSVVIGFDGRINSAVFARDSAQILAGAGIRAFLFDGVVPTPVLAFAGKHLKTSAAIMVTARSGVRPRPSCAPNPGRLSRPPSARGSACPAPRG